MPLGTEKNSLMGAAGAMAKNYFGDGSDGTVTTSGNVTYTVAGKNGSYDGDMYVANYVNLTISAGHTVTVDQPCRGLLLYCKGDLTVNGTLTMSAKGALADPTTGGGSDSGTVGANGLQLGLFDGSGTDTFTNGGVGFSGAGNPARTAVANQDDLNGNGTIYSMSRDGAAGDNGASTGACSEQCRVSGSIGVAGTTGGATISSGGGGSGGAWAHAQQVNSTGGNGAKGSCFSGGSGGGAAIRVIQTGTGGHATDYGGAGGTASKSTSISGGYAAGGGAGNPGGAGQSFNSTDPTPENGTGGMMWVIVKGDVVIATGASITTAGITGAECDNNGGGCGASGGSSGGGPLFILYGGSLTNNGTITSDGGPGETSHNTDSATEPGAGGAGGKHTAVINK